MDRNVLERVFEMLHNATPCGVSERAHEPCTAHMVLKAVERTLRNAGPDRTKMFDMLLEDARCCTCGCRLFRGYLVRMKPVDGQPYGAKSQCADCAARELLSEFGSRKVG